MPPSDDSGFRHEHSSPNEGRLIEVNIDARKHEIEVVARATGALWPVLVGISNADHGSTAVGMDNRVIGPSQVSTRIESDVAVHDDKDIFMICTREPVGERDCCGMGSLNLDHPAGIDSEMSRLIRADGKILWSLKASHASERKRASSGPWHEWRSD